MTIGDGVHTKKKPLSPKYANFEGGARRKKRDFFGQHFPKVRKNAFFHCFFKNLPAEQKFWSKWGLYSNFGELKFSFFF